MAFVEAVEFDWVRAAPIADELVVADPSLLGKAAALVHSAVEASELSLARIGVGLALVESGGRAPLIAAPDSSEVQVIGRDGSAANVADRLDPLQVRVAGVAVRVAYLASRFDVAGVAEQIVSGPGDSRWVERWATAASSSNIS